MSLVERWEKVTVERKQRILCMYEVVSKCIQSVKKKKKMAPERWPTNLTNEFSSQGPCGERRKTATIGCPLPVVLTPTNIRTGNE